MDGCKWDRSLNHLTVGDQASNGDRVGIPYQESGDQDWEMGGHKASQQRGGYWKGSGTISKR